MRYLCAYTKLCNAPICPDCAAARCLDVPDRPQRLCCRARLAVHSAPRRIGVIGQPANDAEAQAIALRIRAMEGEYSRHLLSRTGANRTPRHSRAALPPIEPAALALLRRALGAQGLVTRTQFLMLSQGKNYLQTHHAPDYAMICRRLCRLGLMYQGFDQHTFHATVDGMKATIQSLVSG